MPSDVFAASSSNVRNIVLILGTVLLVAFGSIALLWSNRLARRIESAAAAATTLARGEIPLIGKCSVIEMEHLNQNLVNAARLLRAREAQLIEAKVDAEAASVAKSQFVAMMSHEIRTPLNVLMGYAPMLCDRNLSKDECDEMAEAVVRNGTELTKIVDDLLDLSRIEAGSIHIRSERVDFNDLLGDISHEIGALARSKGLTFALQLENPRLSYFTSDSLRIKQVLRNLLRNAVKFTQQGGVELWVSTENRKGPPSSVWACFRIRDTGIGIKEEDREKLFHPFSQADLTNTRAYGGTGLGLVLSRNIARAMDGEVHLSESTPGKGSEFKFSLPVEDPIFETGDGDLKSAAPSETRIADTARPLQGLRILVAEDSVDNQRLIHFFLKHEQCTVDFAGDGEAAIGMAQENDYDIIVMDIRMPRLDGLMATRRLKESGYTPPIVAVTAHATAIDIRACLDAGCVDVITKPVTKDKLVAAIKATM